MTFAAVDLGTSTLILSSLDPAGNPVVLLNDAGELATPSVVYFDENDKPIVGSEAKHLALLNPERSVEHFKRHMGTDRVLVEVGGQAYQAKDIAVILFRYVSEVYQQRTGEILAEVAVSVPANYTDVQKAHTIEAAREAGLVVVVTPHEPTAAAIGNGVHRRGGGKVLLLDLGGGTFDVALCEVEGDSVRVLRTEGIPRLGGADFTAAILNRVLKEFESMYGTRPCSQSNPIELQDLHTRVEQVKISLSVRESVAIVFSVEGKVLALKLTRSEFDLLTQDLLKQAMDCAERTLREAGVRVEDLREILPVGGASKMPSFLSAIEQRFGRPPSSHADPFFAVALGTRVVGRLKKERDGVQDESRGRKLPPLGLDLQDTTAHAIGVCVVDDENRCRNTVILKESSAIPSEHTAPFQLSSPGQTGAVIQLLQGADGILAEDCSELGKFELKGLRPTYDKPHRIEIVLKIDDSGMLHAKAIDELSNVEEELQVAYSGSQSAAA